ncbi:Protein of unknown function [Bacillus thuringiensis]|uniref:Uncharacterized protein n=1 Tax=Bacillus thuringiensis TaxID=1428 RepID=A0A1C4FQL2_BACTU|nr:Protein of unknown function [Bacillus thuringiensis]SCM05316.1 Protein of unknown function [Bacillus wiedmannii]
MKNFTKGIYS